MECPNCHAILNSGTGKCPKCGANLQNLYATSGNYKPEYVPEYSKAFKIIAIVIFAFGFILGIVVGNVHPIILKAAETSQSLLGNDYTTPAQTAFNGALMFYVWVGFALLGTAFMAIYCHLKHQEELIFRIDRLIEK